MTERLADAELDGFIRQCATNPVSAKRVVAELRVLREQNATHICEGGVIAALKDDEVAELREQNAKLVAAIADQVTNCQCNCAACNRLAVVRASVKEPDDFCDHHIPFDTCEECYQASVKGEPE